MKLKDKLILVTGANGLLGRILVQKIKAEGGNCIAADVNLETNLKSGHINCDVTDQRSVKQVISTIYDQVGALDGLVNAAYPRTKDWGNKFELINLES